MSHVRAASAIVIASPDSDAHARLTFFVSFFPAMRAELTQRYHARVFAPVKHYNVLQL